MKNCELSCKRLIYETPSIVLNYRLARSYLCASFVSPFFFCEFETHGSLNSSPPIGLIVCDEGLRDLIPFFANFALIDKSPGHRLRSANNKTSVMFEALNTPRRVILTGTPIQNDMSEFHAMVGGIMRLFRSTAE
jgi:hypothetical protein